MPTRHGPRHGRATDERWRRTAARTGLEGRSASAGRDRRNRRARIALTAFSEPGWCPDTPPLKRHRGRRWRFSAVRSTNVGSRPALCTAAPPLLPALADHLPVCGSPALATIRSDGELRNGSHRLQRALSRRRHAARTFIHISTACESPPSRSPLVFRRRLRLDSFVRHGLATVRFLVEATGTQPPSCQAAQPIRATTFIVLAKRQMLSRTYAVGINRGQDPPMLPS